MWEGGREMGWGRESLDDALVSSTITFNFLLTSYGSDDSSMPRMQKYYYSG